MGNSRKAFGSLLSTWTVFLGLATIASAQGYSGTYYVELCDSLESLPSPLRPFFGPARLLPDAEVKTLLKIVYDSKNALVTDMPPSARQLEASIKENYLFISSPYSPKPVRPVEKLGKICVMLASGGVSYTVHESTRKVEASAEADKACFLHARQQRKGQPGIDPEDDPE